MNDTDQGNVCGQHDDDGGIKITKIIMIIVMTMNSSTHLGNCLIWSMFLLFTH